MRLATAPGLGPPQHVTAVPSSSSTCGDRHVWVQPTLSWLCRAEVGAGSPPPWVGVCWQCGDKQGCARRGVALPGVWVAGKNSLLFPLKKIAGNHRRKETQRARAQCPLCPHPVPRSKSFKAQSSPIPAPRAGKLPGQPRKARHGGCSHSGQWAGCQPELPQSWPSPFVCMGSASSGLGCPGWWGLLAASRSHLALATRRQLACWWPWVAEGGHCLAGDTSPRPGSFLAGNWLHGPGGEEGRGRSRGWWG